MMFFFTYPTGTGSNLNARVHKALLLRQLLVIAPVFK